MAQDIAAGTWDRWEYSDRVAYIEILTVNGKQADLGWGASEDCLIMEEDGSVHRIDSNATTQVPVNLVSGKFHFFRVGDVYDGAKKNLQARPEVVDTSSHFSYGVEEAQQHAEQVAKMMLGESELGKFRSQVKEVELYGESHSSDIDVDDELTAMVAWELDMDARDWGVKDLNIILREIHVKGVRTIYGEPDPNAEGGIYNEDTEREEDFELRWSPEVEGWQVKVNGENGESFEDLFPISIWPKSVDINMAGRTIEVNF